MVKIEQVNWRKELVCWQLASTNNCPQTPVPCTPLHRRATPRTSVTTTTSSARGLYYPTSQTEMQDPPEPRTSSLAGPVQDNPEGKFNIVQKPRGDQSTLQTAESTRSCPRNIESNQSILQDPEHAVPIGQALPVRATQSDYLNYLR